MWEGIDLREPGPEEFMSFPVSPNDARSPIIRLDFHSQSCRLYACAPSPKTCCALLFVYPEVQDSQVMDFTGV